MKKITAFLSSLVLVFTAAPPAHSDAWGFPDSRTIPDGTTLVAVNEPNVFDAWSLWSAISGNGASTTIRLCPEGAKGPNCDPATSTVIASSILSICQSDADQACVESLRAKVSESDWVTASFTRGVTGQDYSAADQGAIPAGQISLWNMPGVQHSGGQNSYAVVVKLRQAFNRSTQRFEAIGLSANVSPFSTRPGGSVPSSSEGILQGQTRVFTNHDASCIWADSQGCGVLEDFPADTRVEIKLRVPKTITGWFRGRLQDPQIVIDPAGQAANILTVGGLVSNVPRVSIYANRAETPENIAAIIDQAGGKNPNRPLFTGQAIRDFFSNQGDRLFQVLDGLRKTARDSAQGSSTLWNFTTIDSNMNQRCFEEKNEVLGIVTTNATAYVGDPPEFSNGFLSYKVAGMHHAADGKTLNLGTYDLIMSSSVARCLYGFSNAPVQVSIQVVNEGGESTVATTQVSERDGWLKLSAYGFTFSEKDIRVRITQFQPKSYLTPRYSGKSAAPSARQLRELESFATNLEGAQRVACTGFFMKTSERALALARARQACERVTSLTPELTAAPGVKLSKSKSFNFKVSISAR